MTTFKLIVDGKVIAEGTRGKLLEWVRSYYVQRAGYEQRALHNWVKRNAKGEIVAEVSLQKVM